MMKQHVPAETSGLVEFLPGERTAFGTDFAHFKHKFNQSGQFTDAELAKLIDRYPREFYMLTTMTLVGDKPVWRNGDFNGASGREVLEAIRNGRFWLCLRRLDIVAPEIAELIDQGFEDIEAGNPTLKTTRRVSSLLISSPGARVLYHADIPMVSLWHIRGRKRVWLYDADNPEHLPNPVLEGIVLRETEEEIPYEPSWDQQAMTVDLEPGWAVTWPQNAPHRIDNLDSMNVSVTTDYFTPQAQRKYGVYFANGIIRRWLRLSPRSIDVSGIGATMKCAFALIVKKLGLQRHNEREMIMSFKLDPANPGQLFDLPSEEQVPIIQA